MGTSKDEINAILKRYNVAKNKALLWRPLYEDCYFYGIPNRNTYQAKTAGAKLNTNIYDTTAVQAVITYVAHLLVSLTPLEVDWAELRAGQAIPERVKDDFNRQLQPLTELLFNYLHASNYYTALSESHKDLAIGMGVLLCHEGDDENPLIFESVPLEFVYPEEGAFGEIDTIFRDFDNFPVRNILTTWKYATLNFSLQNQLTNAPDSETNIVEGSMFDPLKKIYHYIVLHRETGDVIFEEKDVSSPWIAYRGAKMPGETVGRGVLMEALPTIKTLNEMAGDELKSAALIANPMWFGKTDGVFNPRTARLEPNSIIPIMSMAEKPLEVVQGGGNVQFQQLLMADLRQQINKLFFTNPLGDIQSNSQFTATEIQIRKLQDMEDREPSLGRIIPELLDKLISRVVFILQKRGLFPRLNIDDKQVSLHYKSPLLKSQNLSNILNLTHGVQTLQSIVGTELAPRLLNIEKIPEYVFEQLGIDLDLVKQPDEIHQEMQQYAEALQQQQQQGQLQLPSPPQGGVSQQPQAA